MFKTWAFLAPLGLNACDDQHDHCILHDLQQRKRNENKVQEGKKERRNNEIKRTKLEIAQAFLVPLGLDVSSDQCDCHVLFELQRCKKKSSRKLRLFSTFTCNVIINAIIISF